MCRWYCTSTGPNTNLQCLWCGVYYCGACLHGEYGKMKSLVRCAHCNKNPRSLPDRMRGNWKTLSMETYDPRVVNARRTIQENRNEQVKVDLRHQRRMSGGMTQPPLKKILPRRRKSVMVTVSLFDDDDDDDNNDDEDDDNIEQKQQQHDSVNTNNIMQTNTNNNQLKDDTEDYGTNRSRSGSVTWCEDESNIQLGNHRRQSVWDRLTNVHLYPVNHLRRFDQNFDRGIGIHNVEAHPSISPTQVNNQQGNGEYK